MPATNDKFIFVNAPTIINAGPRDARRQLRSQLMRRVYLRKYRMPPSSQIEDIVDTIEQEPPKEDFERKSSSRAHSTSPPVNAEPWTAATAVSSSLTSIESKLPTPPSEDDGDDACDRPAVSGGSHSPDQSQSIVYARKKAKLFSPEEKDPYDLGPLITISASSINPFAIPNDGASAPNSRLLIHHYARSLIPALRSGKDWYAGVSTHYLNLLPDPIVFNSICLCASVHLDRTTIWSGVDSSEHAVRKWEQHYYRYNALRALRRVLAKANPKIGTPEFDSVLVSICMLAINDLQGETSQGTINRDYNPFSNPLPTLGALNVYGYKPMHCFHWNGLQTLVGKHGGFHNLTLFAARFKISYTAVKYALHTRTKPAFPICNHKGEILTGYSVLEVLGMTPSQIPPHTGEGFRNLQTLMIREYIFRPFIELCHLAKAIPMLLPKCNDPTIKDLVADARNLSQYRFQCLPLVTDDPLMVVDVPVGDSIQAEDSLTNDIIQSAFAVYSLCWLVTHLFTTHVTFPVPSSRRFRLNTVYEIQSTMERCESVAYNNLYVMRLQVWAVVIAGIAAEDVDMGVRVWMASRLRDLCGKLGLDNWSAVSEVLNTFAWLEDACDHAARKLWAEVENMT